MRDNGTIPLFSQVGVIIHVLDINDNYPIFYDSVNRRINKFSTSILEKSPIGSPVYFPFAKDTDLGENKAIHFDIFGAERDLFICNNNTGAVSIAKRIELNSLIATSGVSKNATESVTIAMTIRATDGGHPALSTNLTMRVTVGQISDENPVFGNTSYNFHIAEDTSTGK